mgnify:CR=1 FL=1
MGSKSENWRRKRTALLWLPKVLLALLQLSGLMNGLPGWACVTIEGLRFEFTDQMESVVFMTWSKTDSQLSSSVLTWQTRRTTLVTIKGYWWNVMIGMLEIAIHRKWLPHFFSPHLQITINWFEWLLFAVRKNYLPIAIAWKTSLNRQRIHWKVYVQWLRRIKIHTLIR